MWITIGFCKRINHIFRVYCNITNDDEHVIKKIRSNDLPNIVDLDHVLIRCRDEKLRSAHQHGGRW